MKPYTEQLRSSLKLILQNNETAFIVYEKAAEEASEIFLQRYFHDKAKEGLSFITSLRGALPNIDLVDKEIENNSTGAMHFAWIDVNAFFSGDYAESMLEEAIKADKIAVTKYREVLEYFSLPPSAGDIILQQLNRIKEDLSQSKILEDIH